MKILLHVCCGPCTVYPLKKLREEGHQVEGLFFNPNIHPFKEFKRRIAALREFSEQEKFTVDIDNRYGLQQFLHRVVFNEKKRCSICYDIRLEKIAHDALERGAEAFTTTLLYSKYQNHQLIRKKGDILARTLGVNFLYEDFRSGWQEGIDQSVRMGLYRQPYCGCIYSEQERYDKSLHKKTTNEHR